MVLQQRRGAYQRRKRCSQTQTFWSDIFGWGGGSSTWRGGGRKIRYVLQNPGKLNFLAGYPGALAGISPKVWEKNKFVFNSRPLINQESRIDPWPQYFWKVSRYTSHFYGILLQKYALLLAESSIYTTNLYRDTPPICIAILLQKY